MPLQGLLRRRNRKSDTDLRRQNIVDSSQPLRSSEYVPRNAHSALGTHLSPQGGVQSLDSAGSSTSMLASENTSPIDLASATDLHTLARPRFSLNRFRNASDPQLSTTAKARLDQDSRIPPRFPSGPTTPAIITTAPTSDILERPIKKKQKARIRLPGRNKSSTDSTSPPLQSPGRPSTSRSARGSEGDLRNGESSRSGRVTFEEPNRPSTHLQPDPPAYGEEGNSTLALPISRLSESSRSDGSSGEHVYATQTTTTQISTTTTFFRLPRRQKKNTPSLFPLPVRIPPPNETTTSFGRVSAGDSPISGQRSPRLATSSQTALPINLPNAHEKSSSPYPPSSQAALAASSMNVAAPGTPVLRNDPTQNTHSGNVSPSLQPPIRLGRRGRSSTLSSLNIREDQGIPTPPLPSGRTSTSTTGRASLAGLFNLSYRLRQNSEPPNPRHGSPGLNGPMTPGSSTSQSNSFQLPREALVVPERDGEEPPGKYLSRLQEAVSNGVVASVLSQSADPFHKAVLRSYMRSFAFFENPMDMAIRKLLMDVELPKETQQIDRVLQGFADRYHECNPGIYASPDQAYFIAFSLLILHTDVFNKNNKHKMQKPDYIKNTRGEGIAEDVLECFYDNISYTPFIHVEDEIDLAGDRFHSHKSRKLLFPKANVDPAKKVAREPVDPYTLIIDNRLDILRPNLKEVMHLDDPYSYLGTAESLNLPELQNTFFKTGILQIVSARSRPEAFMSPSTITNPEEASAGVVDIKITKVGMLWRKDTKKKKARSPWQDWGVILTGTQLYFFRNTAWVKNLMHQHDQHQKQGNSGTPVIFKPPLENFKPDALMSTDDAVALLDLTYKKHKHAFTFVRHGGFEETFLAEDEKEMNDWLAKLNYAAAFRTAGVRMRGVVGVNEGQRTRAIRRMNTGSSNRSIQTPINGASPQYDIIDNQQAQQILEARRQIMNQKINEAEEKLVNARNQLENQLRNARHLQILAPIQPKTREQLILAAGRMAAQLKWVRMEIWRLQCHKDILLMDLQEEEKADNLLRNTKHVTNNSLSVAALDRVSLSRLESKTSVISAPKSPHSQLFSRTAKDASATKQDYGLDEIFQSSLGSQRPGFHKAHSSWELPPLSFDAHVDDGMVPLHTRPQSPPQSNTDHRHSVASLAVDTAPGSVAGASGILTTPTPSIDDGELEILKESGLVSPGGTPANARRREPREDQESFKDSKEKGKARMSDGDLSERARADRSKVRRSLHRTLREAHNPVHHRSKKGKDSSSSAGLVEDSGSLQEAEGLARGAGSFTVHGKKASVITFGSEWHTMSPEERIRLRKQAQADDPRVLSPITIEDESESVTTTSAAGGRRGSDVSASAGIEESSVDVWKEQVLPHHRVESSVDGVSESDVDFPEKSNEERTRLAGQGAHRTTTTATTAGDGEPADSESSKEASIDPQETARLHTPQGQSVAA